MNLYMTRCRRWFRRRCRRLLDDAPPDDRQDHPSQASEPRCGQCSQRLGGAPLGQRRQKEGLIVEWDMHGGPVYLYIARYRDGEHRQNGEVIQLGIHQLSTFPDQLGPYPSTLPPERRTLNAFGYHFAILAIRLVRFMLAEDQPRPSPPDLALDLPLSSLLRPGPVRRRVCPPRSRHSLKASFPVDVMMISLRTG